MSANADISDKNTLFRAYELCPDFTYGKRKPLAYAGGYYKGLIITIQQTLFREVF